MVFLFIPNLVGYLRLALLFVSTYTAFTRPITMVVCYSLSQALDWIDGILARRFDQCSLFGGLLDMVTDRVSNAVALAILACLYPNWSFFFFFDIILDIGSHWYQMYSTAVGGESHHKTAVTQWRLLQYYYESYSFMSILIAGNEAFLMTLYLEYYRRQLWSSQMLTWANYLVLFVSFGLFLVKKVVSIVQMISASQKIVELDVKMRQARISAERDL